MEVHEKSITSGLGFPSRSVSAVRRSPKEEKRCVARQYLEIPGTIKHRKVSTTCERNRALTYLWTRPVTGKVVSEELFCYPCVFNLAVERRYPQ